MERFYVYTDQKTLNQHKTQLECLEGVTSVELNYNPTKFPGNVLKVSLAENTPDATHRELTRLKQDSVQPLTHFYLNYNDPGALNRHLYVLRDHPQVASVTPSTYDNLSLKVVCRSLRSDELCDEAPHSASLLPPLESIRREANDLLFHG